LAAHSPPKPCGRDQSHDAQHPLPFRASRTKYPPGNPAVFVPGHKENPESLREILGFLPPWPCQWLKLW
jgi:hypothetical protein